MDLASVIGYIMGTALISGAVIFQTDNPAAFVDTASVMIVIGGASSALMISFPLGTVLSLFKVFKTVFFNSMPDIAEQIDQLVSLSETARRDGILSLEGRFDDVDNEFVVAGLQMAIDGSTAEAIEDRMRVEMEAIEERHGTGKKLLDELGRFAPGFGMIGTLIGLILMLGNDMTPENIGKGMAVALLTTLYGSIVANLFFLPAAGKLAFLSNAELLAMEIAVRGVLSIHAGENPRNIETKLMAYIPPRLRPETE